MFLRASEFCKTKVVLELRPRYGYFKASNCFVPTAFSARQYSPSYMMVQSLWPAEHPAVRAFPLLPSSYASFRSRISFERLEVGSARQAAWSLASSVLMSQCDGRLPEHCSLRAASRVSVRTLRVSLCYALAAAFGPGCVSSST